MRIDKRDLSVLIETWEVFSSLVEDEINSTEDSRTADYLESQLQDFDRLLYRLEKDSEIQHG